jgi:AAA-like domain
MRTFSSYGPIKVNQHIYAPRTALIDLACQQLIGEVGEEDGHYITVWAPRQTGKTWLMQQVVERVRAQGDFEVAILTMQFARNVQDAKTVLRILTDGLSRWFRRDFPTVASFAELADLFTSHWFDKPLILILDEFDALEESIINAFAALFRSIYTQRSNETDRPSAEKSYLLHGLALIGVRSVLGIENVSGSPFNVQRSLRVPNLTAEEVNGMFRWYEEESGQRVEPAVVERIFYETRGQPGLTGWLGELVTQKFNPALHQPITLATFEKAYAAAVKVLPNNNILNVISKARQAPYQEVVLEFFKIDRKVPFTFDDRNLSYLYTNGVIDYELADDDEYYVRFACPFVQKRLFNYFANDLFRYLGGLYDPFEDLSHIINPQGLHIGNLMQLYERYLQKNRHWLFKDAPRRSTDLRIFEAVYHFNLFMYLSRFLENYGGRVTPEFPTGNGKLDLLVQYAGQPYGIEVKSFADQMEYQRSLRQAANYGRQLGLTTISLLLFVKAVDEQNRQKYETLYQDSATGVQVDPIFVATG